MDFQRFANFALFRTVFLLPIDLGSDKKTKVYGGLTFGLPPVVGIERGEGGDSIDSPTLFQYAGDSVEGFNPDIPAFVLVNGKIYSATDLKFPHQSVRAIFVAKDAAVPIVQLTYALKSGRPSCRCTKSKKSRPMGVFMQYDWNKCINCKGMWYAGHSDSGVCPAPGATGHVQEGDDSYYLWVNGVNTYPEESPPHQAQWKWCRKCEGLFYTGNGSNGVCPARGAHDPSESGDYNPFYKGAGGEDGWQWCYQCQGMWHAGEVPGAPCPAGGVHSMTGSGGYSMLQ